jgi:hypothetical protein
MLSRKQEKKCLETILSIATTVKDIDQKIDYIIKSYRDDYYSNAFHQYYKNYGKYLNGKQTV